MIPRERKPLLSLPGARDGRRWRGGGVSSVHVDAQATAARVYAPAAASRKRGVVRVAHGGDAHGLRKEAACGAARARIHRVWVADEGLLSSPACRHTTLVRNDATRAYRGPQQACEDARQRRAGCVQRTPHTTAKYGRAVGAACSAAFGVAHTGTLPRAAQHVRAVPAHVASGRLGQHGGWVRPLTLPYVLVGGGCLCRGLPAQRPRRTSARSRSSPYRGGSWRRRRCQH
jgi:hypothetical protein